MSIPRAERTSLTIAAVLLVVLSALSAVLLAATGSTRTRPPMFRSLPGTIVYSQPYGIAGKAMYFGITQPVNQTAGPLRIHVISARPIVRTNTAGAAVSAVLCTVNPSSGDGDVGSEFGSTIGQTCSALQRATGADYRVRPVGKQQIALRIKPTLQGVVIADGVALTYRVGTTIYTEQVDVGARIDSHA